jgi:hypothetical protein
MEIALGKSVVERLLGRSWNDLSDNFILIYVIVDVDVDPYLLTNHIIFVTYMGSLLGRVEIKLNGSISL